MVNQVSASRIPVPRNDERCQRVPTRSGPWGAKIDLSNHVGPRITSFESPLHGLPHSLPDATFGAP